MDPRMKHPFTCMVAGPTGCGKTSWVKRLLDHASQMIVPPPGRILWCYGKWQEVCRSMSSRVEFVQGLPEFDTMDHSVPTLIVLDDLMRQDGGSVARLFEAGSHHDDISVVYIVQNVFHQGKDSRDISLNAHYLVLFKNPRDRSQIVHLSKQVFPGKAKFLSEAYDDVCKKPHGYLFLDFRQDTPEGGRVRTSVFPGEVQVAYVPKV